MISFLPFVNLRPWFSGSVIAADRGGSRIPDIRNPYPHGNEHTPPSVWDLPAVLAAFLSAVLDGLEGGGTECFQHLYRWGREHLPSRSKWSFRRGHHVGEKFLLVMDAHWPCALFPRAPFNVVRLVELIRVVMGSH